MIDYSTIQQKIADLKTKVTQNSISPEYLGLLLDELVALLQSLDALLTENADTANATAATAVTTAEGALEAANNATETANNATETASDAVSTANAAKKVADSAASQASSVGSQVSSLAVEFTEQMRKHDNDIASLQGSVSAKVDKTTYDARVAEVDEKLATKVDQGDFNDFIEVSFEAALADIQSLREDISDSVSAHEDNVGIYPFKGIGAPTTSSAVSALEDGIWYSTSEGFFYKVLNGKFNGVPEKYNTTVDGETKARTDVIFRCGNVLYIYDGSALKEYVSPSVATELSELRSLVESLTTNS